MSKPNAAGGRLELIAGSAEAMAAAMPHCNIVVGLAATPNAGTPAALNKSLPLQTAIGDAMSVDGHVILIRNGGTVTINGCDAVPKGDVVETGNNGSAELVFMDGSAFQSAPTPTCPWMVVASSFSIGTMRQLRLARVPGRRRSRSSHCPGRMLIAMRNIEWRTRG